MVLIRNYSVADRSKVLALMQANIPAYFDPAELNDFQNYLDFERDEYFVLEVDNNLIACGGINIKPENNAAAISWDLVHPSEQGKGYGSLLLQHRLDRLEKIDQLHSIRVRTSQFTYLFYQKFGFTIVQTVPDYWAKGYDMVEMQLR